MAQLLACCAGLIYTDMLKNFFLITLRNTIRDKAYFILNVLGLSLGIAGSILILLYVNHEINYDKFHPKQIEHTG